MNCSIEPQSNTTPDISGMSEAVYVLLVNDDDGLARKFTGQWSYMQRNAISDTRPQGHMTLEFHYSHNLSWTPPRSDISYLQKFELPAPAKFDWWRAMAPADAGCKNGYKRNSVSVAAGIANTGDLITFQNTPNQTP